jgi:hypothetical protein
VKTIVCALEGCFRRLGAAGRLDEASVGGRRNLPFNLFCGV